MSPPVGFVLITHSQPQQVLRLIARLSELYDEPPICCHHDYSKCDLPRASLPPNVHVVERWMRTRWGGFCVVEGTRRALRELCARADAPEWIVLLSGADYPIKAASAVVADLNAGSFDAHILLNRVHLPPQPNEFDLEFWNRYHHARVLTPKWSPSRGLYWKGLRLPRWLGLHRLGVGRTPFAPGRDCFTGSQWFTMRQRVAAQILDETPDEARLRRHFWKTPFSEEAYFHTLIAHLPGVRVNHQNFRYYDWSGGGAHPKVLGPGDLPKMWTSGDHFARKLPANDPGLLMAIDQLVDGAPARAA